MRKLPKLNVDPFWPHRSWLERWAARIVARMILGADVRQYEVGWNDSGPVFASKYSIAHWVLRQAGYAVTEADLTPSWDLRRAAKA